MLRKFILGNSLCLKEEEKVWEEGSFLGASTAEYPARKVDVHNSIYYFYAIHSPNIVSRNSWSQFGTHYSNQFPEHFLK